jgi:hypothetical protein
VVRIQALRVCGGFLREDCTYLVDYQSTQKPFYNEDNWENVMVNKLGKVSISNVCPTLPSVRLDAYDTYFLGLAHWCFAAEVTLDGRSSAIELAISEAFIRLNFGRELDASFSLTENDKTFLEGMATGLLDRAVETPFEGKLLLNLCSQDEITKSHTIRLAWWNCKLHVPKSKTLSKEKQWAITLKILDELVKNQNCDLISLCEVGDEDVNLLRQKINPYRYAVENLTEKVGRSAFDMAVIYDHKKLKLLETKYLRGSVLKYSYKIGCRLTFSLPDSTKLKVYVVHWPAKLQKDDPSDRVVFGVRLREFLKADNLEGEVTSTILMGDFNDEPYAKSLEHLLTSRDPAICRRNREILYNPFWRKLGARFLPSSAMPQPYVGTYLYQKEMSNWHVFDQIMFSSDFISSGPWHLNEKTVDVVDITTRHDSDLQAKRIDHLPITCTLERMG